MNQVTDAAIVFGSVATGSVRKKASVRATCEAIGLARSTYYYQSHRSPSAIEFEQKIVLRLHELRCRFPNDGYRRMTQQLQLEGYHVNRKRIARLMQLHNLTAKPARQGQMANREPQPGAALANFLDPALLTAANRLWAADITYVRIRSSLIYVAVIIDAWLRTVVGYAASQQAGGRLAKIALHSAVRAHRPASGCVHHSLCGTHYFMRGYRGLLRQFGLVTAVTDGAARSSDPGNSSSHEVIELETFDTWSDVVNNTREFIQAVYPRERIDSLLSRDMLLKAPTHRPTHLARPASSAPRLTGPGRAAPALRF
jgi:putative transposase